MSITDELREYARIHQPYKSELYNAKCADEITAIADRIDAAVDGMIELPKDADGEYIHVGDEVYQVEGGLVYTVESIRFYPDNTTVTFSCKHGFGCDSAHSVRHHHAPTVEDVLTEFGIDWEYESDCEDRAALLKEYASKLRLAEGEDA